MPKFTEETLNRWRRPASETEETKLENAERMIKDAIADYEILKDKRIDIFGQGSYANNTNVRVDSDIDINVCLSSTVFVHIPTGHTQEDFGYSDSAYSFSEYKNDVENALVNKFGRDAVIRKDKCITILGNSYRVEADVVPTFKYNNHINLYKKVEGTKFISDRGEHVVNYPKQHIKNGKDKNSQTLKRYKRLTRIFKRLRLEMIKDNIPISNNISSFLIESLLWNLPDWIFVGYNTWTERLQASIVYLHQETKTDAQCEEWREVSGILYLFDKSRKWTRQDVNTFLLQCAHYLDF